MKTIAIVYFSGTGYTAALASAVQRGAQGVADTAATLFPIVGTDIVEGRFKNDAFLEKITSADAIVFGAPTYMAGPAAPFKTFADATSEIWYHRRWRDKLAAGFTHSGTPSGDKLATLNYFSLFAAQHGMIWINPVEIPSSGPDETNRLGAYLGVMAYGNSDGDQPPSLHSGDRLTAESFGRRIGFATHRLLPSIAGRAPVPEPVTS